MKKILGICVLLSLLLAQTVSAQNIEVEMADAWRRDGKIGVVVTVVAIVLTGIFVYLFMLDRKVSALEKKVQEKK